MELHAETLRRGLVAAGHRVTTITTTLSSGSQTVEDRWGKTYFTDGGRPAAYSSAWNRASVSTLLDIHNQDRFDVIASHGKAAYPYLKSRGRLPGAQRVPVIVISHGNIIDDFRSHAAQLHRRPIRVLAKWLPRDIAYWKDDLRWLRLADHITALSEHDAALVQRWFAIKPSQVSVIPNGVDIQAAVDAEVRRADVRNRLGLDEHTVAILVLASLEPRKGQHILLEALARPEVRGFERPVRLLLAGDGPAHDALCAQTTLLGLAEQVTFLGLVPPDEVPSLLSGMDIIALPSISEGMPLSLLEAMASGHPVVASRVGAIGSVVQDGVSGVLVPPGSPAALAQALLELARDSGRASHIGREGRLRVLADYDQRVMLRRHEQVLLRVSRQRVSRQPPC
jgi:glycosyltransferase involved in cell wall biosynthesis